MTADWHEDHSIGETFPPLQLLHGLSVTSRQMDNCAVGSGDELALRRIRTHSGANTVGDLLDVTWHDVLDWHGVGVGRRDGIMRLLASVSLGAPALATAVDDSEARQATARANHGYEADMEEVRQAAVGAKEAREWQAAVEMLGAWAATVAGGSTWADLVALSSLPRPDDIEQAWRVFAGSTVPLGARARGCDVLTDYVESLDARQRIVLLDRVVGPQRRTLDDIGRELSITRERVRQIEGAIRVLILRSYEESEEWRPVRWATDALKARLGVFAPVILRASALPGMHHDGLRLVTWLAGYRYEDQFLVDEKFQLPSVGALPRVSPEGRVIDEFETIEGMLAAGVKPELVAEAIAAVGGLFRVDDQLVDWTGGQVDRAISVLEVRDEPQDLESLYELAGGASLTSFRNRLFESERIIRVTKSKVGLRSWGGTHYTSITDLMTQRLNSGPMDIHELATELEQMYEVSPNSVVMYAYAPAFKVSGGDMIGLRGRNDPFVPRDKPQSVRGLIRVSSDSWLWHVEVDADLLRGSGRALPQEIGTFLGIAPGGDGIVLRNQTDDVPVTWLDTSITGPNIGSVRLHARALGAVEGDTLRLVFTAGSGKLDVRVVPPHRDGAAPAESLSRLTGLPVGSCHTLGALADAVGVDEAEVVEVLIKRKDSQIALAADMVRLSGSLP